MSGHEREKMWAWKFVEHNFIKVLLDNIAVNVSGKLSNDKDTKAGTPRDDNFWENTCV